MTDLPFIACENEELELGSKWHIPENMGYGDACRLGAVYAVYFMQYLRDNKDSVGGNVLGHLIQEMDLNDKTDSKGVQVGFFSTLEHFLYSNAKKADIWRWLEKEISMTLECEKRMALEELQENIGRDLCKTEEF